MMEENDLDDFVFGKSVFIWGQGSCLPELMSRMLCGYAQLLGISLSVLNFVLVPVFLTLDSTCASVSYQFPALQIPGEPTIAELVAVWGWFRAGVWPDQSAFLESPLLWNVA